MTYALVILTHFTQTVRTRLDDVLTAYPECVNTHPEPIDPSGPGDLPGSLWCGNAISTAVS